MATVRHMRIAPGGWAACAHGHHQRKGIMAYIDMVHSFKRYQMGDTTIVANNDVSFGIEKGELAIILGASGAGKSTVLNILGGMDTNSEGQVIIDGKDISDYNAHQLTEYRRHDIGFVFQFYNLVANLTAKENVELASELVKDAQDPVQALIDVGLKDRINNFPAQLSGGEQQRVAIARAFVNKPPLVLADEPTGNLDPSTADEIMALLGRINRLGATVIMSTHNARAVNDMRRRVMELELGKLVRDDANGVYGRV